MQLLFNRDIIYKEGGITINAVNYYMGYGYYNDIDEEDLDLHIKNPYQYRCKSWHERYSDEVNRIAKHYEKLNAENAKINTIVSIATPEEMKMYEERRNKTDCHRLHINQK